MQSPGASAEYSIEGVEVVAEQAMQSARQVIEAIPTPPSIESDVQSELVAISAFESDLQPIADAWPNAQTQVTQAQADLSKLSTAAAKLHTDISSG